MGAFKQKQRWKHKWKREQRIRENKSIFTILRISSICEVGDANDEINSERVIETGEEIICISDAGRKGELLRANDGKRGRGR